MSSLPLSDCLTRAGDNERTNHIKLRKQASMKFVLYSERDFLLLLLGSSNINIISLTMNTRIPIVYNCCLVIVLKFIKYLSFN
jgi:hypothetical protein